MNENLKRYIQNIPKAELHVHIEGTFEPELMFEIAKRNNIELDHKTVEEVKASYNFNNLQEFLDIYYAGANVLIHEQDFYDLAMAYLKRAHEDNVVHTEIFFDPQTHTSRGVSFETVIDGLSRAQKDAKQQFGISSALIMCFLRHLSEESAFETLELALPHKNKIIGIGLDSSEDGNPPSKFFNVFGKVRDHGFFVVAHAGEEGPAENVWEAIELLEAERIDHGVASIDDELLIEKLRDSEIPLTVCPLSNIKLKVFDDLKEVPVKSLLENEVIVTINSDDPPYFGGYINDNFLHTAKAQDLTREDIFTLAKNSFKAAYIPELERQAYIDKLNEFDESFD